jgi:hypothetical protein
MQRRRRCVGGSQSEIAPRPALAVGCSALLALALVVRVLGCWKAGGGLGPRTLLPPHLFFETHNDTTTGLCCLLLLLLA